MTNHSGHDTHDFNFEHEIKQITAQLTKDIRSKAERASVAREYEDHIHDAMQSYLLGGMCTEEAFSIVCEELGDIGEIAATLGDIHNHNTIPEDVKQEIFLKRSIIGIISFIIYGLLLLIWGFFVVQCTLLLVGIVLMFMMIHLLSALHKRHRATKSICRYAKEYGYRMQANKTVYLSLLFPANVPSIVLEDDTQYIKVRFHATLHKNRVLHFLGRNIFLVTNSYGNALLAVTPLAPGWSLFHPHNMAPLNRSGAVMMTADYSENVYALPTLECRHDPREKVIQEVLIFNPAPMRVFYREGTTETEIIGGEYKDGVWLHDIVSFGTMLKRMKEGSI